MCFIGVDTGYAIGGSSTILKTTDGGNTWVLQAGGLPLLTSVFLRMRILVRKLECRKYRVDSENYRWWNLTEHSAKRITLFLQFSFFCNDTVGCAAGYGRDILKTTDGGLN
ncbi:MAG: hypothetical protein IPP27_17690 [Bacteroidetes bacterium]|nr:hypothetical protein [Bacteroidota bacterium]